MLSNGESDEGIGTWTGDLITVRIERAVVVIPFDVLTEPIEGSFEIRTELPGLRPVCGKWDAGCNGGIWRQHCARRKRRCARCAGVTVRASPETVECIVFVRFCHGSLLVLFPAWVVGHKVSCSDAWVFQICRVFRFLSLPANAAAGTAVARRSGFDLASKSRTLRSQSANHPDRTASRRALILARNMESSRHRNKSSAPQASDGATIDASGDKHEWTGSTNGERGH
jgi:hypothetical protein